MVFIPYITTTLSWLPCFVISYEIGSLVVSYEICEFFSKIILAILYHKFLQFLQKYDWILQGILLNLKTNLDSFKSSSVINAKK